MFSKIDKKVLVVAIVILIVVLVAGFFVYKYFILDRKDMNSTTNQQAVQPTQQSNLPIIEGPKVELQSPTVQTQQQDSLMICADRCGDNICQKAGQICPSNDNLNCACAETHADCPKDCPDVSK